MKGISSLGALAALIFAVDSFSGTARAQTVEYVHTDALGSVIAISNSAGFVTERREYEPYGSQLNPVIENGPAYTGHVQDAETNLIYMQQRYYDPLLGLFISVDSVEVDGVNGALFNRYMYAANNPYSFFDPDGRCTGSRIKNGNGTCASTGGFTTQDMNARSNGESRASTRGEVLRNRVSNGIDSSGVVGPGGKNIAHYFLDDVVDSIGHTVDGNIAPAVKSAALGITIKRLGPLGDKIKNAAGSLGANPFWGKTAGDIAEMFRRKGFVPRGPDPVTGRGSFVNPRTGRGYHIDLNHGPPKGPHVGVHRLRGSRESLAPRDYPTGD